MTTVPGTYVHQLKHFFLSSIFICIFYFILETMMNQRPAYYNRIQNRDQLHTPSSHRRSRAIWDKTRKPNANKMDILRAIVYVLQPIRLSTLNTPRLLNTIYSLWTLVKDSCFIYIPAVLNVGWDFLTRRSRKEWMCFGCILLYWKIVVFLHRVLDAGPMVIIISALFAIFTIGLGDGSGSADGYMSAYNIFNKGFRTMLGGIDVDNLVAQHVGGGNGMAAMLAGRRQQQQEEHEDGDDDDDDNDDGVIHNNNRHKSRKSGKKARRLRDIKAKRDLEREIQLQREAAIAMGFDVNEDNDLDANARLRLMEGEQEGQQH